MELPCEILSYIFQHLDLYDCKAASLVCHTWKDAVFVPPVMRRVLFRLMPKSVSEQDIKLLSCKRVYHLHLDQLDLSKRSSSLVASVCQSFPTCLLTLKITNSDMTDTALVNLLKSFVNLQELHLKDCSQLFMTDVLFASNLHLEKLHVLNFDGVRYITDAVLQAFAKFAPNVHHFQVSSCKITSISTDFSNEAKPVATGQKVMLYFSAIIAYVKANSEHLKSLDFTGTAVKDDIIEDICKVPSLKLESFSVARCADITDKGVLSICQYQRDLKNLSAGRNSALTENILTNLTDNLMNIKQLVLEQCVLMKGRPIRNLYKLRELTHLDLSGLYLITSDQLTSALTVKPLPHLTELLLTRCQVNEDLVVRICKSYGPQLTRLALSTCPITDVCVAFICDKLFNLRYLDLSWCKKITNLPFMGCLPSDGGKSYDHFQPLSNLRYLETLDVSCCSLLTDELAVSEALRLPNLRHLNINNCQKLSDYTIEYITQHSHKLLSIDMSNCPLISNNSMLAIGKHSPNLQHLAMLNCDQVTSQGFRFLCKQCRELRTLDVAFCNDIEPRAVDEAECRLRHLHTVKRRLVGGEREY